MRLRVDSCTFKSSVISLLPLNARWLPSCFSTPNTKQGTPLHRPSAQPASVTVFHHGCWLSSLYFTWCEPVRAPFPIHLGFSSMNSSSLLKGLRVFAAFHTRGVPRVFAGCGRQQPASREKELPNRLFREDSVSKSKIKM